MVNLPEDLIHFNESTTRPIHESTKPSDHDLTKSDQQPKTLNAEPLNPEPGNAYVKINTTGVKKNAKFTEHLDFI
jgi:hypothetical protein